MLACHDVWSPSINSLLWILIILVIYIYHFNMRVIIKRITNAPYFNPCWPMDTNWVAFVGWWWCIIDWHIQYCMPGKLENWIQVKFPLNVSCLELRCRRSYDTVLRRCTWQQTFELSVPEGIGESHPCRPVTHHCLVQQYWNKWTQLRHHVMWYDCVQDMIVRLL